MRKVFFSTSNTCEIGCIMNGPGYQVEQFDNKRNDEKRELSMELPRRDCECGCHLFTIISMVLQRVDVCLIFVEGFVFRRCDSHDFRCAKCEKTETKVYSTKL